MESWTQGGASCVRANRDIPSAVYLSPVPSQLLTSASTDRETLVALCATRNFPAGSDESVQLLKTSLFRFKAITSTMKGARMLEAMDYVRGEAQKRRGELADYDAVVAHPVCQTVDVPAGLSAASGIRKTVL